PLTDKTSGQTSRMLNASVSSNVNIFNGFGDAASLKRDRLLYKALGKSAQRQRQSVIFQTISQFLQTVLSKAFIGIEKENLGAEQKQLNQIEEFRKAGNRSLADVLQQKADIAKAELGLLEAARNYETGKLQLFQILGRKPPDNTEIVSPNVDSLLSVLTAQHPEHLTGEALGLRPDVISREMQIKAAKEQVWVNKSGYWPSVSFSVNGGSNYRSLNKYGGFSDQLLNFNPYVSAGISVSLPLFDRFRTQNGVENAEIQVSNQLLSLKDLTLGAAYEIQKALLDYKTALQQRAAAKSQLKYAKEALEISETRYRVGSLTYVELAQVRAKFLTASYDYAQTNHNLLIKGMAIYFYRGDMNPILSLLK
ncbi:MAG TPA: TolC family protein, partial [Bacteroidetes bacterium]|nr:TolC family protein [Bacteroidota bacterium]